MTSTEMEDRLRELELTNARHEERWANQEKHNVAVDAAITGLREHFDGKFGQVFAKLSKLEIKVAVYAASATAIVTIAAKYLLP